MEIASISLDRFAEVFQRLASEHFTAWEYPSIPPWCGECGHEPYIDVGVKTSRCAYDYMDCDGLGSAYPSEDAMLAAQKVADAFGLRVRWSECEKGWGSLVFKRL